MNELAFSYHARAWSIIPICPKDKTPRIPWTWFQTHRAEPASIEFWLKRWPDMNVGIVCGAVSNLVVVDLDGAEGLRALEKFPATATVQTAHGLHLYFSHPGRPVPNSVKTVWPGADVRGDGGFVLAPPSIHPTGAVYAWTEPTRDWREPLPMLPDWIAQGLDRVPDREPSDTKQDKERRAGPAATGLIPAGERWGRLWSLGRSRRLAGASARVLEDMLRTENFERCNPPLDEPELRRLIKLVQEHPGKRPAGASRG